MQQTVVVILQRSEQKSRCNSINSLSKGRLCEEFHIVVTTHNTKLFSIKHEKLNNLVPQNLRWPDLTLKKFRSNYISNLRKSINTESQHRRRENLNEGQA